MAKALENFLFGLTFGMGFCCAQILLKIIGSFLMSGAGGHNFEFMK